jgi:hypothetical protein
MAWDRILAIHSYHDGPRDGLATILGQRCFFECQFDESADEFSDLFLLMAATPELIELEQEYREIFEAWLSAPDGRQHPVLAEPDSRYHELRAKFRVVKDRSIAAHGEFRRVGSKSGPRDFLVKWSVIPSDGPDRVGSAFAGNDKRQLPRTIAQALIPIIELGASGPQAVVAAAEAVAEEARAWNWYRDRLADQSLSEEQWIRFLDSGDEAVDECRACLRRHAEGASTAGLIQSLRNVAELLRRRPD